MRLFIVFILFPFFLLGQPPENRYQAELFEVTETNDITFSTGVPQPNPGGGFYEWITGLPLNVDEYDTSPVNLQMDIFQPTGDTLQKRPLVIVCFGGGFLSGSKDHWSIRLICEKLAKRGYVAAAIDYRLGMNVFDSDLANRAVYRGLQDARSAVRFFRADAENENIYKVDPDHIFVGGHSSGGFMALHNAYLEKEVERPLSTFEWIQDGQYVPDQECLDCVGDNTGVSGHANAVFSLAGGLGFTSFIESSSDPKVVLFHSTDDDTVPYDSGGPFGSIIWLVVGSDLPDVYGSLPISEQADLVGLPYNFFSYTNRGHDVHEESSSSLYSDIIPGISDWFFNEELKPEYENINGQSTICDNELIKTYWLSEGDGSYFEWEVVGGTILSSMPYTHAIQVEWSEAADTQMVKVSPYSCVDAKGDDLELIVETLTHGQNNFLFQNSNWSDSLNWSLNHSPIPCEDVLFSNPGFFTEVVLSEPAEINSLFLDNNVQLMINSNLSVSQKTAANSNPAMEVLGTLINNTVMTISNFGNSETAKVGPAGSITNTGEIRLKKE